ncbi:MAG: ParA family protein [Candidatus Kariarchaeaceae archaeon]|jgi:MinD-like ATPase involved in chromosome partitioning or flagellar assembly
MAISISLHSHKGGSGKTLFGINLAAYLVKQGNNVVLIDLDLSAPSIQTYAPDRTGPTMNEMFLNNAKAEDVIFDATHLLGDVGTGKLYMGLADISGSAISKINQRDEKSLLNDLFLLMELVRNKLPEDPWNADYILIDTSPGLTTHAINGVAVTDQVVMLLRLVNADVEGTRHFLQVLHKSVKPKTSLVINQIPEKYVMSGGYERIHDLVSKRIISPLNQDNISFAGILEMDENIISTELDFAFTFLDLGEENAKNRPRPIHLLQESNKSFEYKFEKIASSIMRG